MKSSRHFTTLAIILFVTLAISCQAQQPAPAAAPSIPTTGFAGLDQYRARRIAVFTDDFGQLARYRDANAALAAPKPGEDRVVFFGDSITDIWHLDEYFPAKAYINRGIGGQTTPQMLVRFRQDVINLQPKVVIILAGTNDIAGNTGPMRLEDIEADYATIADLSRANHIKVIYSSVLPVHNYTEKAKDFFAQRPQQKILVLNNWLRSYCAIPANGCTFLDYYGALVDTKGMLKKELADDGLHQRLLGRAVPEGCASAVVPWLNVPSSTHSRTRSPNASRFTSPTTTGVIEASQARAWAASPSSHRPWCPPASSAAARCPAHRARNCPVHSSSSAELPSISIRSASDTYARTLTAAPARSGTSPAAISRRMASWRASW